MIPIPGATKAGKFVGKGVDLAWKKGSKYLKGLSSSMKGLIGELAAKRTLLRAGYKYKDARLARNQGFDGVFVKYGANDVVEDIIITESKFAWFGKAKLNNLKSKNFKQMSNEWVDWNIGRMIEQGPTEEVRALGWFLQEYRHLIRRKANVCSADGTNAWYKIQFND